MTVIVDTSPTDRLLDTADDMIPVSAASLSQLFESLGDLDDWTATGAGSGPRNRHRVPAAHTGGLPHLQRYYSDRFDRDHGRYRPFYDAERHLRRMRVVTRGLATYSPVAIACETALRVYVMGGDWEYKVVPRDPHELNPTLIEAAQRILDDNLDMNDWLGDMDREVHDQSRVDGEAPIAMYPAPHGRVRLDVLDSDCLEEPANKTQLTRWLQIPERDERGRDVNCWNFGVHTAYDPILRRIDHANPHGYHCVFDDAGRDWDYLPRFPRRDMGTESGKCLHFIKRNTPRRAKRGISDYWATILDIEREDKLSENTAVGAAVNAAIAWIEESPIGTARRDAVDDVSAVLDQFSLALGQNRDTGTTPHVLVPGQKVQISAGKKFHASPMGQLRSQIFILVGQALKRRAGSRWLLPEYIISSDASNSNYASTLVAESPFIKAREEDQSFYKQRFRRMWLKALKIAFDAGQLPASSWTEVRQQIDIEITAPNPASRDHLKLAQTLQLLLDKGVITQETMAVEMGYPPEDVSEPPTQPSLGDSLLTQAIESVSTPDEAVQWLDVVTRPEYQQCLFE